MSGVERFLNKAVSSLFLSLLLMSVFVAWFSIQPSVHAQGETFVSVVNAVDGTSDFNFTSATPVGTVFTANITVTNVRFLAAWQINITYDAALLAITGDDQLVMPSDNVFFEYPDKYRVVIAPGWVFWGANPSLGAPFDYVNVTGTQTLCQINFTIIKNDENVWSPLHLVVVGEVGQYNIHTDIINYDAESILFTPRHGHYYLLAAGETFVSVVNAVDGTSDFNFTSATPVGTVFTANVTVTDVTFLAAWQINITYDPTLLNITEDNQCVMPSDNVFGQDADAIRPYRLPGMVYWCALFRHYAPFDYVNITGTGTLCQINFTVIKNDTAASTELHLVDVGENIGFGTMMLDPNVEEIPFTPRDGHYSVGLKVVSCLGDINLDFLTDGKDFVLVKRAMGSTPGSPRWNPGADLNSDGSVGVQDYQIVKNHIPSVFP